MTSVLDLLPADFLKKYWQQQPYWVRGQFAKLLTQINLDKTSLFNWSSDERLASRLIQGSHVHNQWQVDFGPFDTDAFKHLGQNNWTLLVQDLDKVDNYCHNLLKAFDFIPHWRLDDVMASIATEGGSVGPHVDQYDVFLIQLSGQRHWQWSNNFDSTLLEDQPLAVLKHFKPEQEATLLAGDMLYLPPGVAHHGVASGDDDCITLSVGCRAPSLADVLHALAEQVEHTPNNLRYRDPPTASSNNLSNRQTLDHQHAHQLRELLKHALSQNDEQLLSGFAQLLSEYRLNDALLDYPNIDTATTAKQYFIQQPAARIIWHATNNEHAIVFCNGARLECNIAAARLITNTAPWQASQLHEIMHSEYGQNASSELLEALLANGGIKILI